MAQGAATFRLKKPSVIPGFGLTLGFTLTYLSLIVLIPLAGLVIKTTELGWAEFLDIAIHPQTLAALRLSFGASLVAAVINTFFGVIIAWVLVRYRFPFRRLLDGFIDLPFALPTAVAGISLTALYAPNGWIGQFFADLGIRIVYTPVGITIALVFIGLPFVVRTVQPVMEEFDREVEEASATLGATRRQTIFRVLLPTILPSVLTGSALAFARAVGEYGSVIFIAGNIPYVTEIAPQLIVMRLTEYNYAAATAIATIMLALSFALLLVINLLQAWARKGIGNG